MRNIEEYLSNQQVYVTTDIVDSDLRTIAHAHKVYLVGRVEVERLNLDTVVLRIEIGNKWANLYRNHALDLKFESWVKKVFIPVSVLWKTYQKQ